MEQEYSYRDDSPQIRGRLDIQARLQKARPKKHGKTVSRRIKQGDIDPTKGDFRFGPNGPYPLRPEHKVEGSSSESGKGPFPVKRGKKGEESVIGDVKKDPTNPKGKEWEYRKRGGSWQGGSKDKVNASDALQGKARAKSLMAAFDKSMELIDVVLAKGGDACDVSELFEDPRNDSKTKKDKKGGPKDSKKALKPRTGAPQGGRAQLPKTPGMAARPTF